METDLIRRRAYALWQAAGAPSGRDQEFWFSAEKECGGDEQDRRGESDKLDEGLSESFPASDPPAAVAPHRVGDS